MKIIEHKFQPGTISFYNELSGKRSYWFSAHNLFAEVLDNEAAVDIIAHWDEQEVAAVSQATLEDEHWLDYELDHELVICPVEHR